ncbi:hypothetical protein Poli38472_005061 [Pythium oligandrum]|uniref:Glucosylceramidase n=1 Tax=Pythium oligandrum TaxID=41045 RepID=A0A8K1FL95_PYTOL|nr:hypothetical protein Poli38472_005061 [Pythium oligandrum]|eukprot:TMW62443.1 hypothetical protein Poli38472_005061 [Pythium oligandrum]
MLRSWGFVTLLALVGLGHAHAAVAKTECTNYSAKFKKDLDGVCVCTEDDCDSVSNDYLSLKKGEVGVFSTSKGGDRLTYTARAVDSKAVAADFILDTATTYQKIIGFGGAFTDAAAINVYKLTPALQQAALDAYYSENGIEYTLGRIPISSTDFSESVYSYNPVVDDFEMENFSIDVDRAPNSHKLELIKRVLEMSSRDLTLFASSWSPPLWMTKENKTEDCHIKGSPGEKYWKALALYYTRFVEEYEKEGVNIWGLTVQNEPVKPIIQLKRWQSLRMSAEEERDFIKKDLGPLLKERFPDIKLISHDDQKPDLIDRLAVVKDDEARKYIDGVGVHWYKNLDFWFFGTGGDYDKLAEFHKKYPDLFILATEACEGSLPDWLGSGRGVKLNDYEKSWARGEMYARDIIDDVANFAAGWTDWNIVLDTNGGPNWATNVVDAPIIVDEVSGAEFYKQPMYYVMGHFSKFVPPGSVRINLKTANSKNWNYMHYVAFLTPEKRVVAVICSRRDEAVTVVLQTPSQQTVTLNLAPHTLQTIILP